jgi:hypothetical protein
MATGHFGHTAALLGSCLLLAACGGGGGGPAASPSAAPAVANSAASPADATVGQPQTASLRGNSPLLASGSTPDFTTNLPPNGTVFPLNDTVLKIAPYFGPTGNSVTDATSSLSGGTTLTFQGTQANGVKLYEFKEPSLSIDVPNLTSGAFVKLPDGNEIRMFTRELNYTVLSAWAVSSPSSSSNGYSGFGFSGYQTPASAVPTSGTATYASTGSNGFLGGGVAGFVFVPSGPSTETGELKGQASVSVNFQAGTVAGAFTNMTAFIEGDMPAPTPWNDVTLAGTLSGAAMKGTTAAATSPSNDLSLGGGAKGTFTGALFGPHGEEMGMGWNLYDPTGNGKAAIGTLGATKQ